MDVLLMTFLWAQRKLYEAFLKSELVHLAVQPKGSPLAAITVRSPSFLYSDTVYCYGAAAGGPEGHKDRIRDKISWIRIRLDKIELVT